MSQIQISNLQFCYPGSYDPVFSGLTLTLDDHWKLGLIGRNGRGKTTLLRLLLGQLHGQGHIQAQTSFCYFPAPVPQPTQTARAVLRALGNGCPDWQLERELNLLGVDACVLDRPYCTLSPGEQTKAQLAALFTRENAFPLIDEPTNHLDCEGRMRLAAYLRRKPGFLLVSHDRSLLDGCVDHILSLGRADIELQKGNFSSWQQNRQQQDDFERAQNERLQKEIARLSDAARRTAAWSDQVEKTKYASKNSGLRPDRGFIGHKSAKMMRRAKSVERRRETAIEEKSALLHNVECVDDLTFSPLVHHAAQLLTLTEVAPCYDNRPVCAPVRLTVQPQERIALAGGNGAGKSSLLALLAGQPLEHTGTIVRASGLIVSYVPQQTEGLSGSLAAYAAACGIEYSLFLTILRKFGFARAQFEKDLSAFSEGQKKKTLLARSLCQHAHLYVWDEPLNFVDLETRQQLEDVLRRIQPTLVFVEHDRSFTTQIATRTLTLTPP